MVFMRVIAGAGAHPIIKDKDNAVKTMEGRGAPVGRGLAVLVEKNAVAAEDTNVAAMTVRLATPTTMIIGITTENMIERNTMTVGGTIAAPPTL